MEKMKGVCLPGDSRVEFVNKEIPVPGYGQVLLEVKTATICGSDIEGLYKGLFQFRPEKERIAGHEAAGIIAGIGFGVKQFKKGDRVILYHASGCGVCRFCRSGYNHLCENLPQTYGWQRDGSMAKYVLAEERDLLRLPDSLSYLDGAQLSCSFGAAYEAVDTAGVNGKDTVLVTGLGPVGLSVLMLCKAFGARCCIGVEPNAYRRELAAELGIADFVLNPETAEEQILNITKRKGVRKAFDCSGTREGRSTAVCMTATNGTVVLLGEGGTMNLNPTPDLIHGLKRIYGSWGSVHWRLEELTELLEEWKLHPETLVTHTFPLEKAQEAFQLAAERGCGKVAICIQDSMATAVSDNF